MDESKLQPAQIIDPRTGDTARTEDILGEVQAVLKKYGYGMIFNRQRGAMCLAKIGGPGGTQARVIAEIRRITPEGSVFRVIDWTPKPGEIN